MDIREGRPLSSQLGPRWRRFARVVTFRGHRRRVAVIRLDGDPGLDRIGFDRSDNLRSSRITLRAD